ncbi:MAG TPA: rhodanese-like domain-containing protein [Gaiellaceae bacterium]|nr:rhodanese-like domain-containing protein [Gaiellaceae bacterium]
MSALPPVVDADWLAAHLGEEGLLLADVRGPNAHARQHLPGSIPLVLGAPGQSTEREALEAFATEAALRLRRHGVTGEERLVLYDGGDCVSAASALQVAELAGHPRVSVLAGGLAGWPGPTESGVVELERSRAELEPRLDAVATLAELAERLGGPDLTLVDTRREDEYRGRSGYPCDPRQGHIPGARHVEVSTLFAGPGTPKPREDVRAAAGIADGSEDVVCYCHSGSRSGLAVLALRLAGYPARNYLGSWHEWSRHAELPLER